MKKKSKYKLLNNLENIYQQNYSVTISNLSKALLIEIDKEIKKK